MPSYKLTYFDFDGGRGEPIRIAFHAAGIEFDDHRISFPEFGEMRKDTRFNAVPVLHIDGIEVSQSNSILRYVGKSAGLYPTNEMQALYCDEVMDALEDLGHYIVRTFGLKGDELKSAREKLVEGWLTTYIRGLEGLLTRGGGEYFADGKLTIADLKVFTQTRSLRSGTLDHVPTDLVDKLAPGLAAHQERVQDDPRVIAYYESRA
ncbi:MAG: glutathione S-transferase [Woeseiaceae bacterium]|nr:glutathione S-transferase [Woeseiaceae bacterium]